MTGTAMIAVAKREFLTYLYSPLVFVFVAMFLFLSMAFTFYVGNFLGRNEADLIAFFAFHPYIYLLFIPAIAMRLWAEERRLGTVELLLTLPISPLAVVVGKFLAAWAFTALTLFLTGTIWLTVVFLGDPDQGMIISGYLGSFLLAGAFLAIGSFVSVLTKNQVIAFIVSAVVCFLFLVTGLSLVTDFLSGWLAAPLVNMLTGLSALTHFENFMKGVLDVRSLFYFLSLIMLGIAATVLGLHRVRG